MNTDKKTIDDREFFLNFSLFWVIFGALSLFSALGNFFYAWIFIVYIFLGLFYLAWTFQKNKRKLSLSKNFLITNGIFFIFVLLFSFFSTPTVFSGRDQGSISNAAIELSHNHKLEFSNKASTEFFSIYGPGKALNFPGFYYTKNGDLTTQFPLGYISWLAAFFSLFGITGLVIANSVTLFIFLSSFYLLGKELFGKEYSNLMLAFTLTSFSFIWFFKYTLSENLAMALLWVIILAVFYLIKNPNRKLFFLYLLAISLLIFTRIEGYAFFITSISALLITKKSREFIKENYKPIFYAILIFTIIFLLNLQKDFPFFKQIIKASLDSISETTTNSNDLVRKFIFPGINILQIHFIYGLLGFLIVGFFGILKILRKKQFSILIPLFVAFPALIYIVESKISSDHPWMLRRFVFAVLPIMILYSVYAIRYLKNSLSEKYSFFLKYSYSIIIIILLASNIIPFTRYAFYKNDEELLQETENISKKFSSNDLILIDRLASGNGWSMISGPMMTIFKKQAVYFFNINDIKKINLKKFDNVYLIIPEEKISFYAASEIGNQLDIIEKYTLKTTKVSTQIKNNLISLIKYPEKETTETDGYILKLNK